MPIKREPITVKRADTYSVNFYGLHIPKGAVYVKLPEQVIRGRFMPATYAWVTDLAMAKTQQHFYVNVLTTQDKRPRRVYMDGERGYARLLKNYIVTIPADKLSVEMGGRQRKAIIAQAPKDRKVPEPMQRMRESYFTAPDVITDYYTNDYLVIP